MSLFARVEVVNRGDWWVAFFDGERFARVAPGAVSTITARAAENLHTLPGCLRLATDPDQEPLRFDFERWRWVPAAAVRVSRPIWTQRPNLHERRQAAQEPRA